MYFVSFDIDFNKTKYALVDVKGQIYDKLEYDTPTNTKESFYGNYKRCELLLFTA